MNAYENESETSESDCVVNCCRRYRFERARRKRLRSCENGVWLHRVTFACSSQPTQAGDRFN